MKKFDGWGVNKRDLVIVANVVLQETKRSTNVICNLQNVQISVVVRTDLVRTVEEVFFCCPSASA